MTEPHPRPLAEIKGIAMGLLTATGATARQHPHLAFLDVRLDPGGRHSVNATSYQRLATPEGQDPSDWMASRTALERKLLAGLRDTSVARIRQVGLHLFRHSERGGPGSVNTSFDRISLALLSRLGISPAWLLLLAALLEDYEIYLVPPGAPGAGPPAIKVRQRGQDEEPIITTEMHLGRSVYWNGEGVTMPDLPETIRSASEGEELRRVVSHPVLDAYDLRIREVRPDGLLDVGYVPYHSIDWRTGKVA